MNELTFQEYETHFTVMNYGGVTGMTNMRCGEFMTEFNKEYTDRGIKFEDLNDKAHKAIADVFIAYQTRYGKEIQAAGNLNHSRAYYGVDVMIDQDQEAKLLEVTFAPDMDRFAKFVPEGFNEVFGNMFFDENKGLTRII